jgi:hypothetical protein
MRYVFAAILFLLPTASMAMLDDMELVGEGKAKYLGFITVYDAALYARGPIASGNILGPETSRCLKLDYAVTVSAEDFILAADTVLERQHDGGKLAAVAAEIDRLHRNYSEVGKGDTYALCYEAEDTTTTLYRNGEVQVEIVSADFAGIYFGIWLGPEEPLSDSLRNSLLGRN